MKPVDWIVLGAVLLCVGLAVFGILRSRKKGKRCCGDCSACTGCEPKKTADKSKNL